MRDKLRRLRRYLRYGVDWELTVTALVALITVVLVGVALYSAFYPPACAEGFIYFKGYCLNGYRP